MFKQLIRFIQGVGHFLAGKEPDEIKLARAEAEIREQEAKTMQALEDMGSLAAGYEREVNTLRPQLEELEDKIKALIAAGKEDLASEFASDYDMIEVEYNHAKEMLESTKEDLKVRYQQSEIELDKIAKQLKNIKDNRKRAAIDKRINDLRKTTSPRSFATTGLQQDLTQLDQRTKEQLDKNKGTKMVLDLDTKQTKEALKKEEEIRTATGRNKLARFAAKRGIALTGEKEGAPQTLGEEDQTKA